MTSERELRELYDRMGEFARFCASGEGASFLLEGKLNVAIIFHTFTGIFSESDDGPKRVSDVATVARRNASAMEFYNRILNIELPESLRSSNPEDDLVLRKYSFNVAKQNGYPYLMVGLGEEELSDTEGMYLFSIHGYSPQSALAETKDRIRDRLASISN